MKKMLLLIASLGLGQITVAQDGNFDKLNFNQITKGNGASDYSGWGLNTNPILDVRQNGGQALVINHHDGLTFSAHSNYGGIRFYNQGYPIGPLEPSTGSKMVMSINGNAVGIGTTEPRSPLDIGADIKDQKLGVVLGRLPEGDNVGEGTFLGVRGYNTTADYGFKSFALEHSFYGITNNSINFLRGGSQTGGCITFNTNINIEQMRISSEGNVLIGKTTQSNTAYKLDINGKIRANEIVVNTTGADFVFEPTYKLRSLIELEQFVKNNKHLPEIPTAKTMQKEGVGVSELQTKLLQKVEELTLYLIEKDKQINKEKEKNINQDKRIVILEEKLNKLIK